MDNALSSEWTLPIWTQLYGYVSWEEAGIIWIEFTGECCYAPSFKCPPHKNSDSFSVEVLRPSLLHEDPDPPPGNSVWKVWKSCGKKWRLSQKPKWSKMRKFVKYPNETYLKRTHQTPKKVRLKKRIISARKSANFTLVYFKLWPWPKTSKDCARFDIRSMAFSMRKNHNCF